VLEHRDPEELMEQISRRFFLASIPALAFASQAFPQSSKRSIPVRSLNHVTLTVRNPNRSLDFYQGLFGLPIQSRQGNSVFLQIGTGPQFIGISGTAGPPRISHFCVTTPNFNSDRVFEILAEHGVARIEYGASGSEAADIGPLKAWLRHRREDRGGSAEGTPELHFADPEGILAQIQDATYCGGSGALGEECLATPEPSPRKGLLALQDYNHITLGVTNQQRTREFYRALFGMPTQSRQAASESLKIGSGRQFLAIGTTTANGGTPGKPNVAHVCFTIEGFDLARVRKALTDYGLKPVDRASGPASPLTHYVSLRMPDRGGAPGGTPELYFTDPDGLVLQLQDTSYCGGAGYLGNVCP
jgi:catechol 2,3-dioxygenase-like lactoylglutathione lyase family enzyme